MLNQLCAVPLLIALLTSGCDAPDTAPPGNCATSSTGQPTQSETTYQDACVLGRKNTQSDDRKW